jgi:magnesium chelatase subunit D
VGQQRLKDALVLNAINPSVGGLLIRGEKGTAKSTLARALADLLPPIDVVPGCPYQCDPDAPFVDCPHCRPLREEGPLPRTRRPMRVLTLPTNATEDRVCGTLDLEHAIQSGERRFEPGVLAGVHRGILYIDEVNLLDDHIVDVLLDAAAMGVNTVEREGVQMVHPSQFILIGTMNPEEGDLRPQLLDRFGLCVDVEAILDVEARAEIIRRRLTWERDQESFAARYHEQQHALSHAIVDARRCLPGVTLDDEQLHQIARLCVALDIRSHRADIVIAEAAMGFAAWDGRERVNEEDIQRAAELALPHRTRRRPFEESRLDPEQIAQAMEPPETEPAPHDEADEPNQRDEPTPPENVAPPEQEPQRRPPSGEQVFDMAESPEITLPDPGDDRRRRNTSGRRARSVSDARRGRYVRASSPSDPAQAGDVALDATLRAAAPHQRARKAESADENGLALRPSDVRVKVRERAVGTTILLVVDASGSMGAAERMRAAKGATFSLLRDAYVRRDQVGMIAFRDGKAEVLLRPTDSVDLAQERLQALPTGGRTPLAHGLMQALEMAHQAWNRDADALVMAVLISDGKANQPYDPDFDGAPYDEAVAIAQRLTQAGVHLLVLDTEDDFLTLGLARDLAEASGANYIKLSELEAAAVERAIRKTRAPTEEHRG